MSGTEAHRCSTFLHNNGKYATEHATDHQRAEWAWHVLLGDINSPYALARADQLKTSIAYHLLILENLSMKYYF